MQTVAPAAIRQASPALRDRFLAALDQGDASAVLDIARDLLGCTNLLPTMTCFQLGLSAGSTYGDAAEAVRAAPRAVRHQAA